MAEFHKGQLSRARQQASAHARKASGAGPKIVIADLSQSSIANPKPKPNPKPAASPKPVSHKPKAQDSSSETRSAKASGVTSIAAPASQAHPPVGHLGIQEMAKSRRSSSSRHTVTTLHGAPSSSTVTPIEVPESDPLSLSNIPLPQPQTKPVDLFLGQTPPCDTPAEVFGPFLSQAYLDEQDAALKGKHCAGSEDGEISDQESHHSLGQRREGDHKRERDPDREREGESEHQDSERECETEREHEREREREREAIALRERERERQRELERKRKCDEGEGEDLGDPLKKQQVRDPDSSVLEAFMSRLDARMTTFMQDTRSQQEEFEQKMQSQMDAWYFDLPYEESQPIPNAQPNQSSRPNPPPVQRSTLSEDDGPLLRYSEEEYEEGECEEWEE